jgi:hypothetical protein
MNAALKQESRKPLSLSELRKVLTAVKSKAEFNRLWIEYQYDRELICGRSEIDLDNLEMFRTGILEHFAEKAKAKIAHDSQSQAIPPHSQPDITLTKQDSQENFVNNAAILEQKKQSLESLKRALPYADGQAYYRDKDEIARLEREIKQINSDDKQAEIYVIPAEEEFDRMEMKIGSDFAGNLEPAETKELVVFSPFEVEPVDFKNSLDKRSENRGTLIRWISGNLIEGIDKGRIHFVSKDKCPAKKAGRECNDESHYTKYMLFKPGAEKICGLVGLRAEFEGITDYIALAIAGKKIDVVILRCRLYSGDRVVAEGTGSRLVSKDYGDINKSIKMAEKSGQIDAIMRCAGLSEIFSQEDILEKEEAATAAKVDEKAEVSKLQALKNRLQEATHELHLQNIWKKHNNEIKALSEQDRKSLIALKDVLKVSLAAKAQLAAKAKPVVTPPEPERITSEQLDRIREIIKHGGTGAEFLTELELENLCQFANDPYSSKADAEAYLAKNIALIKERKLQN